MEEKYCNIKGVNIFYRVNGVGEILLLIHGFGETGEIWNNIIAYLPENCKIIVPDLPGSGRSEILKHPLISINDYAQIINHLINVELANQADSPITIIGHSMGGYIALSYLDQFPKSVNRLGLFHSTAFADSPDKIYTRKKAIEFIQQKGANIFLKTTIIDLFSKKSKTTIKNIINDLLEKGNKFSNESLIQYYKAMITRKDSIDLIKQASIPFLFIIGEEDNAVPLDQSLIQCHLPVRSYVKILKDAGHMGMLEAPNETGKAIADFFKL